MSKAALGVLAEIAARADRNETVSVSVPADVLAEIAARADRNLPFSFLLTSVVLAEIAARADRNVRRTARIFYSILAEIAARADRNVAYWSIDTPIDTYGPDGALCISANDVRMAVTMSSRLNSFSEEEPELLLAVGYAGADAALRARGLATNAPAAKLPVA